LHFDQWQGQPGQAADLTLQEAVRQTAAAQRA
jgi:hypothetical protein